MIIPIRVGDLEIETNPTVKYLGVLIGSKMHFNEQIRRTADKGTKKSCEAKEYVYCGPLPYNTLPKHADETPESFSSTFCLGVG